MSGTCTRTAIIVAWWGLFSIWPVHAQDIDIKASTDGRCDYWLPMLAEHPAERVVFTGKDKHGEKVKVLSDGTRWRFVLLAGTAKPLFGCVFLEGGQEIAP